MNSEVEIWCLMVSHEISLNVKWCLMRGRIKDEKEWELGAVYIVGNPGGNPRLCHGLILKSSS